MKHILTVLIGLFLLAGAVAAQGIYVDPGNGDDVTGDGSSALPYKTLGKALSVATAGTDIWLRDGSPLNLTSYGTGNGEVFPLALKDQVDIRPEVGMAPDFDGGGAPVLFTVGESITAATTVVLRRAGNCGKILSYDGSTGLGIKGLVFEDTRCDTFTDAGVEILAGSGTDNQVVVRNCILVGDALSQPARGVRVGAFGSATTLVGGAVEDCSIEECATGIEVTSLGGGDVADTFMVRRNTVTNSSIQGIALLAAPSAASDALLACGVKGNEIVGNAAGYGLFIHPSKAAGSLMAAEVSSSIAYNVIRGHAWAVNMLTDNTAGSGVAVDITCLFTGNVFTASTVGGILFQAIFPQTGAANMAPNFGVGVLGGRNTFDNQGVPEWVYQGDMVNVAQIKAQRNFWTLLGSTTAIIADMTLGAAPPPDVSSPLDDTLTGETVPAQIVEHTAVTVRVNAGTNSAFVDNDDPAATAGRFQAWLGGTPIPVSMSSDGSYFTFVSPDLGEGRFTILLLNPGGQGGNVGLEVVSGGDGGSSTGICVVATAAHGDYDAPEVRVLRRFRDDYLLTNRLGRTLTAAYYEHGPAAAEYIAGHEWARRATRAALAPPVLLSEALLTWNRGQRLLAGVGLLGLAFLFLRRRR